MKQKYDPRQHKSQNSIFNENNNTHINRCSFSLNKNSLINSKNNTNQQKSLLLSFSSSNAIKTQSEKLNNSSSNNNNNINNNLNCCSNQTIPLSKFCVQRNYRSSFYFFSRNIYKDDFFFVKKDILTDQNQILFTKCNSSECKYPVIPSLSPSCPVHVPLNLDSESNLKIGLSIDLYGEKSKNQGSISRVSKHLKELYDLIIKNKNTDYESLIEEETEEEEDEEVDEIIEDIAINSENSVSDKLESTENSHSNLISIKEELIDDNKEKIDKEKEASLESSSSDSSLSTTSSSSSESTSDSSSSSNTSSDSESDSSTSTDDDSESTTTTEDDSSTSSSSSSDNSDDDADSNDAQNSVKNEEN